MEVKIKLTTFQAMMNFLYRTEVGQIITLLATEVNPQLNQPPPAAPEAKDAQKELRKYAADIVDEIKKEGDMQKDKEKLKKAEAPPKPVKRKKA